MRECLCYYKVENNLIMNLLLYANNDEEKKISLNIKHFLLKLRW